MNEAEIIIRFIVAVIALLGTVTLVNRLSAHQANKAVEAERQARVALERELRKDLSDAKTALDFEKQQRKLEQARIQSLEDQREADKRKHEGYEEEIRTMRGQIGTLLAEMAVLQGQVKTLTDALSKEQQDNKDLRRDILARDETIRRLTAEKSDLAIRCESYRDALALVRGETAEQSEPEEDQAAGIVAAQEGLEHG